MGRKEIYKSNKDKKVGDKCIYNNKNSSCGACSSTFRKDNKNVHFVVKGVHSYSNFNK